MIRLNDSAAITRGVNFVLNNDAYEGFNTAAKNGQIRLAIEYATSIISAQREAIERLEAQVAELQNAAAPKAATEEPVELEPEKPVARKASSRKVGGKKVESEGDENDGSSE